MKRSVLLYLSLLIVGFWMHPELSYSQGTNPGLINNWPPAGMATDTVQFDDYSFAYVPAFCLAYACDDWINRDLYQTSLSGAPIYTIHLKIHLIRDDNGGNAPSIQDVEDMVTKANRDFAGITADTAGFPNLDTRIQFCYSIETYDNSVYRVANGSTAAAWVSSQPTWGGINYIDVVLNAEPNSVNGFSARNQPNLANAGQYVWVRHASVNDFERTLSHEIGHYLGLHHTYIGITPSLPIRPLPHPNNLNAINITCGSCVEKLGMSLASRDSVGDHCGDTDPDPQLPTQHFGPPVHCGKDCDDSLNTCLTYRNIMQYTGHIQAVLFSPHQAARMRCYLVNNDPQLLTIANPTCNGEPTADFNSDRQYMCIGDTVQFNNLSSSDVCSWAWDFGDGTTSTLADPAHVYASAGIYTVTLTVTRCGNFTTHTYTRTQYIEVVPAGLSLPYFQDFNSQLFPPNFWNIDISNDSWNWFRGYSRNLGIPGVYPVPIRPHTDIWIVDPVTNVPSAANSNSGAAFITGSYTPTDHNLYSPLFDFSNVSNPELEFYYAHLPAASPDPNVTNCDHNWIGLLPADYSTICNPAFCFGWQQPALYNEVFRVYASVDTGQTWQYLLFDESGPSFNTVAGTPCDIWIFAPLDTSSWQQETIRLCDLAGHPKVQFRFEHTADVFSAELFVDNVSVTNAGAPFTVFTQNTPANCQQGGFIDVYAPGAVPPLTFTLRDFQTGQTTTQTLNTSSANFGPLFGSNYSVMVSDTFGNCASDTAQITVGNVPCCAAPNSDWVTFVGFRDQATALITAHNNNDYFYQERLSINDVFIVDHDITFDQCELFLGPDAQIIVRSGKTLTISKGSRLEACDNKMWEGILIQDQTGALIMRASHLQDAKNAIVSRDGGHYLLDRNTYTLNLKHLTVESFPGNHTGTMYGNRFTGGGATNLLPPANIFQEMLGIEITDVGHIVVGDQISLTTANIFEDLEQGINIYRSDVELYDNDFINIAPNFLSTRPNARTGEGIYAEGNPGLFVLQSLYHDVTIGGRAPQEQNTFTDVWEAIQIRDNYNAHIENNTFESPNFQGSHAIRLQECYKNRIDILNNEITRFKYGIRLTLTSGSRCTIQRNSYEHHPQSDCHGILVEDIAQSRGWTSTRYDILDNAVISNRDGIKVQAAMNASMLRNTVRMVPGSVPFLHGIRVDGSIYSKVMENQLYAATATPQAGMHGIYVQASPQTLISCNNSRTFGEHITLEGAVMDCETWDNVMFSVADAGNVGRGMVWRNGAYTGPLGGVGNPTGNVWNGVFSGAEALCDGTFGSFITYYYRSTGVQTPNPNRGILSGFPLDTIPTNGFIRRRCQDQILGIGVSGKLQIATGGLSNSVNNSGTNFEMDRYLYNELQLNSSLQNTLSFHNFLTNRVKLSQKVLKDQESLIGNGDLENFAKLNLGFSARDNVEGNYWQVNQLLTNFFRFGPDCMGTLEQQELASIAGQCPLEGGNAVYIARSLFALLDTDRTWEGDCAGISKTYEVVHENFREEKPSTTLKMFPNPASQSVSFQHPVGNCEVHIFSLFGQEVTRFTLNSPEAIVLSLEGWSKGIYLVQVSNGQNLKLVIQ